MKPFKIRCSAIAQIVKKPRTKGALLSETARSYCDRWIKEQLFNREHSFTNKYTQKGLIVEDESIDLIADVLGYGFLIKNEQFYENDFLTGTPDILPPNYNIVIDAKSSWDWQTFPYTEDKCPNTDYHWQVLGYMALTNRDNAKIAYTLVNTPEHLIEREARRYCYDNGFEELDMDIYKKFETFMNYSDIPKQMRVKSFDFKRDNEKIEYIYKCVENCREYINQKIKIVCQ